nr:MAG TPA: hypothetical protein [Caudoviricetes sp.]
MALTPAAAALRSNATRIGAIISKRLTRLAAKDIQGGDILVARLKAELEEIRAMPVTNYNEARSKEARMRRLNNAAGTKAETFQKAAKRAYRDDLVAQANDPNKLIRMTKEQLQETLSVQRSRLRDRVRYVKQSIGGGNFMTHRAENLLKEKTADASINRLRSLSSGSAKALQSKSLTPQGAKEMIQRGVDMFGDTYLDLNDEQRSALWKAMRREMELNSISSPDAIELIKTAVESVKKKFGFVRSLSSDELLAAIGDSTSDVEVKLKRIEIDDRNSSDIIARGKKKWGSKPNPISWSTTTWDRDYNF